MPLGIGIVLVVVGVFVIVALIWVAGSRADRRAAEERQERAQQWEVDAEGAYDRVEYQLGRYGSWTVVYFEDGRTCNLDSRYDMICKKGANIRISRNGIGHYRIEEI